MLLGIVFLLAADACGLGADALERRDLPGAEKHLKQCVAAQPQLAAYLQLCAVYQLQRNTQALYRTAEEGLKHFPGEKRFYLTVGMQAGREKRFARAAEVLNEANRRWPDDTAIRDGMANAELGLGMELLDAGKDAGAEKHLRRAVELAPTDIEAHLNLARVLHNLHRPADSLAAVDRVLQLDARAPLAHFHRGMALYSLGDFDSADAEFTLEIAATPDYGPSYLLRAQSRMAKGDWGAALADAEAAAARMPGDAKAQYARARCLLQTGKLAEAEAALRQAMASDPRDPAPVNSLATLLLRSGRAGEAQPLLQRAAELSRNQRTAAPGEIRFQSLQTRKAR